MAKPFTPETLPEWVTQEVRDEIEGSKYNDLSIYALTVNKSLLRVYARKNTNLNIPVYTWQVQITDDGLKEKLAGQEHYFLTIAEANLIDTTWRDSYSIENEYDYELQENKAQQEAIHNYVLVAVQAEEEIWSLTNEANPLLPYIVKPEDLGKESENVIKDTITINGENGESASIQTTKKHIDAYAVTRPHVAMFHHLDAASRAGIIAMLENGGTVDPSQEAQGDPDASGPSPFFMGWDGMSTSPVVKFQSFTADPNAPLQVGQATHYVLPEYVKYEKAVNIEPELKDQRVYGQGILPLDIDEQEEQKKFKSIITKVETYAPAYTLIKVNKVGVGKNKKYCEVILLTEAGEPQPPIQQAYGPGMDPGDDSQPALYMEVRHLSSYDPDWVPPLKKRAPKEGEASTNFWNPHRMIPHPADWTELAENAEYGCYLEREGLASSTPGTYITKIIPYLTTEDFQFPFREASKRYWFLDVENFTKEVSLYKCRAQGAKKILRFYDKDISWSKIKKMCKNKTEGAPFVEAAPDGDGIYQKDRPGSPIEMAVYFPQETLEAIPNREYDADDLAKYFGGQAAKRSFHFEYGRLKGLCELIAKEAIKHATKVELQFPQHAKRMHNAAKHLKAFPSKMLQYLNLNGVTESELSDKAVTIELGLGMPGLVAQDFILQYVLLNKTDESARPLAVGLNPRCDDFSIVLQNHYELSPELWDTQTMFHLLWASEKIIKQSKDKKYPSTQFVQDYHYPWVALKPSKTPADPLAESKAAPKPEEDKAKASQEEITKKHKAPVGAGKTKEQRVAEDRELQNPARKQKIYTHRERAVDFTGDNIVEDMIFLHKNVNTADDLFTHFLNKTNLKQMAEIAVSAMMCSMSDDARQKMMMASMIANTAADCIEEIITEFKTHYPEDYEKAKKALHAEKKEKAEKGIKDDGKPVPTPSVLRGRDGNTSSIKEGKAKDALDPLAADVDASSPTGSGKDIVSQLPADKKEELKNEAKDKASVTGKEAQPPEKEKLTAKDRKRMLLIVANDSKDAYKIARPVFQNLIYKCIPDHEIQTALEKFFQKVDHYAEVIPPVPPEKVPRTDVKDKKKTSDPSPGIGKLIAEAIRKALLDALMVTVILILKEIKAAADQDCEKDYGSMAGKISDGEAKEAFAKAGIPPEMAPQMMECLLQKITKSELEDLFKGIITDDVRAAILVCANEVGAKDYISSMPDAFDALNDIADPNLFRDHESVISNPGGPSSASFNADPTGLLCADDGVDDNLDPMARRRGDRTRKLVEKIRKAIDDGTRLLPELPPITSDCGEQGMVPRDMPSNQKANRLVMDAYFSGVKMSFREDANGFKDTLIVKELRPAQPGDIDYVESGMIDKIEGFKVDGEEAAIIRNQRNQKMKFMLGATLKEDLTKSTNFTLSTLEDGSLSLTCQGQVIVIPDAIEGDASSTAQDLTESIEIQKEKLSKLKDMKKQMKEMLGESIETLPLDQKISQAEFAIGSMETQREEAHQETTQLDSIERKQTDEGLIRYTVPRINLSHGNPFSAGPPTGGTHPPKDDYKINFMDGAKGSRYTLIEQSVPLDTPVPYEVGQYELPIVENGQPNTYLGESFLDFIIKRAGDTGCSIYPKDFKDTSSGLVRELHKSIFESLMQQIARQVAFSPMFDINYYENFSFTNKSMGSICDVQDDTGESVDLLALAEIQNEIMDEYEKSCTPVSPEESPTTALDNAIRAGLVKTYLRLHLLEVMMKSVFVFSEYNAKDILEDDLLLQYLLDKFRDNVIASDLDFYESILDDAMDILDDRIDRGENLETLHKLDVLEALTGPAGSRRWAHKEAALKYLALEQFGDLAEKFESAVGSRTPSVHERFLQPPQNNNPDSPGTTPDLMPVQIPNTQEHGWIRTIDVPVAQKATREDSRFTVNELFPESKQNYSKAIIPGLNTGTTAEMELTKQQASLKYPDMASAGGTFFLEKYVRVEDVTLESGNVVDDTHTKLRQRIGGPDGDVAQATDHLLTGFFVGKVKPHLSGVVNIPAWKAYLEDEGLGGSMTSILLGKSGASYKEYLKPLKWGIRLVYVPKLTKPVRAKDDDGNKLPPFWVAQDWEQALSMSVNNGTLETTDPSSLGDAKVVSNISDLGDILEGAFEGFGDGEYSQLFGTMDDHLIDESEDNTKFIKNVINLLGADVEKIRKEKILNIEEAVLLEQKSEISMVHQSSFASGGFTNSEAHSVGGTVMNYQAWEQSFCTIPLAVYEEEIGVDSFDAFLNEEYNLEHMRSKLMETEEYKFLFNYVFPLPRMTSLLTIYSANSITYSIPETIRSFDQTKGVLRNLYRSVAPDVDGRPWWDQPSAKELGLAGADAKDSHDGGVSTKGSGPNYLAIAMRTVPILIRGMADYYDPHYKFVSKLNDYGILPTGKTWKSVPIFWPSNWFGWGPPIGPWGIMAYGMPQLPGESKKSKQAKQKEEAGILADPSNTPVCSDIEE